MSEGLISIIAPIYKVEAYLRPCVDSLINQTYGNLEIILVDDGSPDGCGAICDEYAKKDERIRVIHKGNAGVAAARNSGLDVAQGEYISFIDSDDWVSLDAYRIMMDEMLRSKADIVVGACVDMIEEDDGTLKNKPEKDDPSKYGVFDGEQAMRRTLISGSAAWNRLFKKEIFKELRFPIGRINDDEYVALRAYAMAKRISYIPNKTYYYRLRKNSITTSGFSMKKVDLYYNAKDNLAYIKENYPTLLHEAESRCARELIYCYFMLFIKKDKSDEESEAMRELHDVLHKREMGRVVHHNEYLDIKYKLLFAFAKAVR